MLFGRRTKNPIRLADKGIVEWKYTTCGYCSTGCSIEVGLDRRDRPVSSRGVADADVNRGKLCIKGILEHELFRNTPGRGDKPLLRDHLSKPFREAPWNKALDKTADEIRRIQSRHGRDAFAIVSTGQIMTEEFYTLGKLARGVIGTNNYDGNTTLCMSSAVSGYKRSFGSDGPPGCYEDFDHTECLLAFGSNLPEQHPVIYWRLKEALEKRKFPVIVIDPRVTMFAQAADMHLPVNPGTDLVLLNSLAHVILNENLHDPDYIAAHTEGFEEFKALVAQYDPTPAAGICGIDEDTIRHVARLFARSRSALSIWTMGINQSTHGSDGVVAINNLHLITGKIGKPGSAPLSITGQCNAMGTREWSSCSGLPGYRALEKEKDRRPRNMTNDVRASSTIGLILAGGRSRRMGTDKALVTLAGRPLLAHVVERLAPQVDRVVISSNASPVRFAAFGLPVLADILGGHRGPLAGVHAALAAFPGSAIVSVAVDLPLLPRDLVARLKAGWDGARCRFAACGGRHALAVLWPSGLASALEGFLLEGHFSVSEWLDRHGEPVVVLPSGDADLGHNINTPADLAQAEALVAHQGR